jgi:hypothetical protein
MSIDSLRNEFNFYKMVATYDYSISIFRDNKVDTDEYFIKRDSDNFKNLKKYVLSVPAYGCDMITKPYYTLVLKGVLGCGKTTLMVSLLEELKKEDKCNYVYIDANELARLLYKKKDTRLLINKIEDMIRVELRKLYNIENRNDNKNYIAICKEILTGNILSNNNIKNKVDTIFNEAIYNCKTEFNKFHDYYNVKNLEEWFDLNYQSDK